MDINQAIVFAIGKQWIQEFDIDSEEVQSMMLSNPEEFASRFIILKITAPIIMEFIKYT